MHTIMQIGHHLIAFDLTQTVKAKILNSSQTASESKTKTNSFLFQYQQTHKVVHQFFFVELGKLKGFAFKSNAFCYFNLK